MGRTNSQLDNIDKSIGQKIVSVRGRWTRKEGNKE